MIKTMTVKRCIENGIERMKNDRYNVARLKELTASINKYGFESTETIDKFLGAVASEAAERRQLGETFWILWDIAKAPKCEQRLFETIHLYGEFVFYVVYFLEECGRERDIEEVSKIVFKNKKTYYKCFETFMGINYEKAIEYYYKYFNEFPNALFFRKMEAKSNRYYSISRMFLEVCMNKIMNGQVCRVAEEKFWNENLELMLEEIPRGAFHNFLSRRYMKLIPYLEFMKSDVQEIVLKRLALRKEDKIFKDGYTRLIAYYIIGKCMDSKTCEKDLIEKLSAVERLVDWKELLRIFNIAYEEVDSYEVNMKSKLFNVCEYSKEAFNRKREKDFEEFLGMLA